MATRFSRRLYSRTRQTRSSRAYRFPRRAGYSYRSRGRTYRGYGSYATVAARVAPYALQAIPYIYRGYRAYQAGGGAGLKRYAGSLASGLARRAIKAVTGYGAYRGVGRGGMSGTQAPSIRNGSLDGGSIVISHKEYLGDVYSSSTVGAFNIYTYRINPGDPNTFPWLSQCAKNFQQYRVEGMGFHFKSMSGDSLTNANTALGSVMMCTQYDATQTPPNSKSEMENMEYAQSIKPSQSITHFVECAKNQSPLTELFVNENPQNQNGDKRFYDFAQFSIGTIGMQAASVNLGELWVSYQIRLFKPQLWEALGRDVECFNFGCNSTGGVSNSQPFGTIDKTKPWLNPSYFYPQNNIYCFHEEPLGILMQGSQVPKSYLVTLNYSGTTAANVNLLTNFIVQNCTLISSFLGTNAGGHSEFHCPPANISTTDVTFTFTVKIDETNEGKPWGFGWSANPVLPGGTLNYFVMSITEIPYTTS